MKLLLIPLALVAGGAMACPGDGVKDATAPMTEKVAAVATAPGVNTAASKAVSLKLAVKPAAQPRKTASL